MNKGIVLAIFSSFTFSIMNVLVKLVSDTIPSNEIAFFRGIIGSIIMFFIIKYKDIEFSKNQKSLLVLRGLLGGLYMVTYFFAISTMKLGDVSILVHLSAVFVFIFSSIFLKEKINKQSYYIIPIILLGTVIVINPFRYSTYSFYAIFGLLSAILSAAASITIRQLAKSKLHHNYEIVFYFLMSSTLVAIPLMWENFVFPGFREFMILIIIAIVSLIAQIFLTGAFSHENAVIVEVVRYIGIVINAGWGFILWGEVLTINSIIGGSLIIIGSIMLSKIKI